MTVPFDQLCRRGLDSSEQRLHHRGLVMEEILRGRPLDLRSVCSRRPVRVRSTRETGGNLPNTPRSRRSLPVLCTRKLRSCRDRTVGCMPAVASWAEDEGSSEKISLGSMDRQQFARTFAPTFSGLTAVESDSMNGKDRRVRLGAFRWFEQGERVDVRKLQVRRNVCSLELRDVHHLASILDGRVRGLRRRERPFLRVWGSRVAERPTRSAGTDYPVHRALGFSLGLNASR